MPRVWPVALMVGVALWLTARPVAAQVVVASVRSTDAVLESVAYFATLFGRDDIAKQLESFIDTLTGNKGLVGSIGAILSFSMYRLCPRRASKRQR
jgi:tetrahydromethanopterin S-methyltransferase subunit F